MKREQPEQAVPLLERALSQDATTEEAAYYLGLAHQQLGNLDEACRVWQSGLGAAEQAAYQEHCQ